MCEAGANPEALSSVVKEVQREANALRNQVCFLWMRSDILCCANMSLWHVVGEQDNGH